VALLAPGGAGLGWCQVPAIPLESHDYPAGRAAPSWPIFSAAPIS